MIIMLVVTLIQAMNNSLFNTTLEHPFIFAGYTDNYLEGKWVDIYSNEV